MSNARTFQLSGKIVSSESKAILNLALVSVSQQSNPARIIAVVQTPTDGSFRIDSLSADTYTISVTRLGYQSWSRSVGIIGNTVICADLRFSGERAWMPYPTFPTVVNADSMQLARAMGLVLAGDIMKLPGDAQRNVCTPTAILESSGFRREMESALRDGSGTFVRASGFEVDQLSYSIGDVILARTYAASWPLGEARPFVDSAQVTVTTLAARSGNFTYSEVFREIFARNSGSWQHVGRDFIQATSGAMINTPCR